MVAGTERAFGSTNEIAWGAGVEATGGFGTNWLATSDGGGSVAGMMIIFGVARFFGLEK